MRTSGARGGGGGAMEERSRGASRGEIGTSSAVVAVRYPIDVSGAVSRSERATVLATPEVVTPWLQQLLFAVGTRRAGACELSASCDAM